MSNLAKVEVIIKELSIFEQVCKKHEVEAIRKTGQYQGQEIALQLRDTHNAIGRDDYNPTYVTTHPETKGAYQLVIDNDDQYNSITKRLGANGGILMRDYAHEAFKKQAMRQGVTIQNTTINSDQSITLRVAC